MKTDAQRASVLINGVPRVLSISVFHYGALKTANQGHPLQARTLELSEGVAVLGEQATTAMLPTPATKPPILSPLGPPPRRPRTRSASPQLSKHSKPECSYPPSPSDSYPATLLFKATVQTHYSLDPGATGEGVFKELQVLRWWAGGGGGGGV